MVRSLEDRVMKLEHHQTQKRALTDAERAIRLHRMLLEGWIPPDWLQRRIPSLQRQCPPNRPLQGDDDANAGQQGDA
ncbi:MAG TPA: hypothetical protein PKC60_05760 [Hydrogenophaga sp.]|uniref:hypothetical protein n=1 Tax=Hydrogenophaga sp. TaxID=1904254 RepID=UPI002CAFDF7A|nr:hypothetical protein [Hydrogenophaga sp.]HMN92720.1 hypothetical protein [Hydrogenophaga sp.]HMP08878.1 hypothetical protein [Hydrogenophaga sp.]